MAAAVRWAREHALEINTVIEAPVAVIAMAMPKLLYPTMTDEMLLPAYMFGAAIAGITSVSAVAVGAHGCSGAAAKAHAACDDSTG